ncbi:MAG: hypothetical protein P4L46_19980 [Fimbriimonas sp.]|nr:hypothetical protein [Fimbriimonas sp.]
MNKKTIVSSVLAALTLGVVAAALKTPDYGFNFLKGSTRIDHSESVIRPHVEATIERFNLHEPYDKAWGDAEIELCESKGWCIGTGSRSRQSFVLKNQAVVSIFRGKVDANLDNVEGTDGTDTYVIVERVR